MNRKSRNLFKKKEIGGQNISNIACTFLGTIRIFWCTNFSEIGSVYTKEHLKKIKVIFRDSTEAVITTITFSSCQDLMVPWKCSLKVSLTSRLIRWENCMMFWRILFYICYVDQINKMLFSHKLICFIWSKMDCSWFFNLWYKPFFDIILCHFFM